MKIIIVIIIIDTTNYDRIQYAIDIDVILRDIMNKTKIASIKLN